MCTYKAETLLLRLPSNQVVHVLIPPGRQIPVSFKVSLVYILNSRTARATPRDAVVV